jgi:hypothetical protein
MCFTGLKMQTQTELTPDGIIVSRYLGDQTGETVKESYNQLMPLVAQLQAEQRPVLILIDMSRTGKQNASARMAAQETLRTIPFKKMAAFGSSVYLKHITLFILNLLGMSDKFGFFDTEEEAMKWLKQ